MKRERKLENWLKGLRRSTGKRKLSSNMPEAYQSHARSAGLKAEESEHPLNTSLYDVYTCPLSVYIDIVVDNKLKGLVVSGNPTPEELENAKLRLMSDFAEIANSGESQAITEVINSYYAQRNAINGLKIALKLVLAGRFEKAIEYLNKNGVKCSAPANEGEFKALIDKIHLKLKNRMAKFKEISSRYKILSKKGDKPTRRYYNKLLVMLSTCEIIKMQLDPKKMTVAEFAEYLNIFNEYQNHLKIKKHAKCGNN